MQNSKNLFTVFYILHFV